MSTDPSPEQLPTFDPEPVQALFALQEDENDTEMLHSILQQFLVDSDHTIRELEASVAESDARRSSELAHSLKGGAATFGLSQMRAWSFLLEQDGRQGRTDRLANLLQNIKTAYQAGRPSIEAILTGSNPAR